jgi:hypothetical protein
MARFRHLHAADGNGLDFDWRQVPMGGLETYHAPLENGDLIELHGLRSKRREGPTRWSYHIMGPIDPEVELVEKPGGGWGHTKPGVWTTMGTNGGKYRAALGSGGQGDLRAEEEATGKTNQFTPLRLPTMHHDMHEAMRAAEHHYRALNRRGITPSHTEDYDINDIMRRFDGGEL